MVPVLGEPLSALQLRNSILALAIFDQLCASHAPTTKLPENKGENFLMYLAPGTYSYYYTSPALPS